ncbi:hypothetical protein MCSF7_02512 [Mycoplasmopsis columbina SF7]|uniref:Uncharacterized protein n=1 Tax=Mycoplasmopsis columbina SF7 TaxID=1037410 RepID=F9UKT4_9BACT|nr:hypothetical protein MCSF7_02512 [Mycoplasmopsis columbina SF7]
MPFLLLLHDEAIKAIEGKEIIDVVVNIFLIFMNLTFYNFYFHFLLIIQAIILLIRLAV